MPGSKAHAAVLLVLVLVPSLLLAQTKPDCSDPKTQSEMTICAGMDYEAADAELNIIYNAVIAQMKDMDADLPHELKGAERSVREAQRAWIPYRDKACESYGFIVRGGSMEPMLVASCLAELTRNRIKELKAISDGHVN